MANNMDPCHSIISYYSRHRHRNERFKRISRNLIVILQLEAPVLQSAALDAIHPVRNSMLHGKVIGSWMLRGSVAYEAGMGVSTGAARDACRQESE